MLKSKLKILLLFSLLLNFSGIISYYGIEKAINITSRIENYFQFQPVFSCAKENNLYYYSVNDPIFRVHGVLNTEYDGEKFSRIILNDTDVRNSLKIQAKNTAGVRVRFKTSSNYLSLTFTGLARPGYSYPHHSEYGSGGIDVYVNNKYAKTVLVSDCGSSIQLIDHKNNKMNNIDLFLPNFSKSRLIEIGLAKGASVEQSESYDKAMLFYGTSITQGSGVSRASLSYPAIISRALNADFYNLGFSGNAQGDLEIAEEISRANTDLVFLEFSRQAKVYNGSIGNRLKVFYYTIRKKNKSVPIVIVSSFYDISERLGNVSLENRRKEFFEAYLDLKKNDTNIYFIHGNSLLGKDDLDGLVDGTHPNALGAYKIAKRATPILEEIFKN